MCRRALLKNLIGKPKLTNNNRLGFLYKRKIGDDY